MVGVLLAYDSDYNVIATRDWQVIYDEAGHPLGLADFERHELAGGEHTEIWTVSQTFDGVERPARGSKFWPEFLGPGAHDFRVELEGPPGAKRITALVHRESGHRRERSAFDAAVRDRIAATPAGEEPDLRAIVGGPNRPLPIDEHGRTAQRPVRRVPKVPLIGVR